MSNAISSCHTSPFYSGVIAMCTFVPWEPKPPCDHSTDMTKSAGLSAALTPCLHRLASPQRSLSPPPRPLPDRSPPFPWTAFSTNAFWMNKNFRHYSLCYELFKRVPPWPRQETPSPTLESRSTRSRAVKSEQPRSFGHKGGDPCFPFQPYNPRKTDHL